MDNADLEKLTISPGKLCPIFHPKTVEYSVTLGSDVQQLKIDPLTSDCGASYSISGISGKIVDLSEGETTSIKIEVTAEDGVTIKNYIINATRLSAKEALLNYLKCSEGELSPAFAANIQSYTAVVPLSVSSIQIMATAADKKTALKLNGGEDFNGPIQLNFGETKVEVEVTSPDKSACKLYTVNVWKQQLLRPAHLVKKGDMKAECPICLGIPHRPKSIEGSKSGRVYCKSCIDEMTRTSKQDPLDCTPLVGEWRCNEFELDKELSSSPAYCVFAHWGCTEKPALYDLGSHMNRCEYRPVKVEKSSELVAAKDLQTKSKDCTMVCSDCTRPVRTKEIETHKMYMCTSKTTPVSILHKVEVRPWEKTLRRETSEKSADKLMLTAKGFEEEYLKAIPKHGCAGQFSGDVHPLQLLNSAAEWYATAIKLAPKDGRFHFHLAQIYEELYYCQDLYGLKPQKTSELELDFNLKSKESSKEDDIQALCESHGVGRNAVLSLQLKAIDEEYHYLLEQGRSDKAEYVQQLYAFKSKQTLKNSKTGEIAVHEEEHLGKAYLKYMDALACNEDDHVYNLHAGRMLILQGKHDEAVFRLQAAVGLKPANIESRFYLGVGLAQQTGGAGERKDEAIGYISEGLEYMLILKPEEGNREFVASNPIKPSNVHCLQALLILADQVKGNPSVPVGVMSAVDAYHCAAIACTRVLHSLVARGDTYYAVEWILFQAHSSLLQLALEAEKQSKPMDQILVTSRCDNLSALIKNSHLPPGKQVLELQEKICQQAVLLQPTNSRSIYLLGDAQLRCYDNDPTNSKDRLLECQDTYRVSLELEGKPSGGKSLPEKIRQQNWYKERQAKFQSEEKAKNTSTAQKPSTVSKTGGVTGKGAAPARGRGTTSIGRAGTTPSARGGVTAKPAAPRGRVSPKKATTTQPRSGGTSAKQTNFAPKSSASSTKPLSSHKSGACAGAKSYSQIQKTTEKPQEAVSSQSDNETEKPVGPLNKPSYQSRLGLARVLLRKGADMDEAHKLYEEVISMAPEFHDAYIELADSLVKFDPMKAVEVYSKYPFKEDQSFDDAYIHGEIVRLIMKQEKFEDPRLGPSLISLGRTMGLSVIEKYVETLDKTFKYSKLLCQVYAGVHGKDVEDPDLQHFFRFKCWI